MAPSPLRQAGTEEFAEQYRLAQTPVMRAIECTACGHDYGGTSWTTREEALRVCRLLGLRPGARLLELGAGSGWPGLFVARETGCEATLVDLPLDALRIALRRARADRLGERCRAAVADAAALPFASDSFDAIGHSDVLCCLEAKLAVLEACRRVARRDATMVFTVISVAPHLTSTEHERAVELGPPFVDAATPYADMLRRAGWHTTDCLDITAEYGRTTEKVLREEQARAQALRELLGAQRFEERLERWRGKLDVIARGHLRRELFVAHRRS